MSFPAPLLDLVIQTYILQEVMLQQKQSADRSFANEIDVSSLSERFQMGFRSRASINISEEAEQPVASIISITTGTVVPVRVITTFKALVHLAGHS